MRSARCSSAFSRAAVRTLPGLLLLLPAMAQAQPESLPVVSVASSGITYENYPRVDGSTSTMFLGQLVAARLLDIPSELRRIDLVGSFGPYDFGGEPDINTALVHPIDMPIERLYPFRQLLEERIARSGTHEAYTELMEGNADLILIAREPSADEMALAREKGITLDIRPVGLDAFAFTVNSGNPVEDLSLDQIRRIFSGELSVWGQVGGEEAPIVPLTRNRNSGSEELMQSLVMKDAAMVSPSVRPPLKTMSLMMETVAGIDDAIGYTVLLYQRVIYPMGNTKVIAVNGVHPTPATIADGTYPLVAPVYVVTRTDLPPDSPAAIVRNWMLSPEGQQTVAASGFVPVKP